MIKLSRDFSKKDWQFMLMKILGWKWNEKFMQLERYDGITFQVLHFRQLQSGVKLWKIITG